MALSATAMGVRRWLLYAIVLIGAALAWLVLSAGSAQAEGSLIRPDGDEGVGHTAHQVRQVVERLASSPARSAAHAASEGADRVADRPQQPKGSEPAGSVEHVDAAKLAMTVGGAIDTVGDAAETEAASAADVVQEAAEPVVEPVLGGVGGVLTGKRPDLVAGAAEPRGRPSKTVRAPSGTAAPDRTTKVSTTNGPGSGRSAPEVGARGFAELTPVALATIALIEAADVEAPAAAVEETARDAVADLGGGLVPSPASVTGSVSAPTFIALLGALTAGLGLALVGLAVARDRRTPSAPARAPGSTPD